MRIREIVENSLPVPRVPAVFYHATSTTRLASIQKHGLTPQPSHDDPHRVGIYLTDDYGVAMNYLDVAGDRRGGNGVILKVDGSAIDPRFLEPDDYEVQNGIDDYHSADDKDEIGQLTGIKVDDRFAPYRKWQDVPWWISLATTKQVFYAKAIPLRFLRRVL